MILINPSSTRYSCERILAVCHRCHQNIHEVLPNISPMICNLDVFECCSHDLIGDEKLEDVLQLKDLKRLVKCFEDPQHVIDNDDMEEEEDEDAACDDEFRYVGDEQEKDEVIKDNDKPDMAMRADEFLRHLKMCLGLRTTGQDMLIALKELEGLNKGLIIWKDLCCYLEQRFRINDYSRQHHVMPLRELPVIFKLPQNRRQMTVKMLISKSPNRLLTFTQKGIACSWNPRSLKQQRRIFLFNNATATASDGSRVRQKQRRRSAEGAASAGGNVWISDVVLMEDCHKMAVASSRRDVRIFDLSTALSSNECRVEEEYFIHGLPNWTASMEYVNSTPKTPSSHLLLADDKGKVHHLEFLRPTFQLFPTNHKQGDPSVKISFEEMASHDGPTSWTGFLRYRSMQLAGESISKMKYFPEQDRLIVGSSCPSGSIIITDLYCKRKAYRFNVAKGITCFDYDQSSKVLLSGSCDRLVRVWDGYVTERPLAVLQGHRCGILDVIIDKSVGLFFSLSRDGVLKIWDGKKYDCLQSWSIKFCKKVEISNIENRNDNKVINKNKNKTKQSRDDGGFFLEFSNFPMLLDNQRRQLLVTCGCEMASIRLQTEDEVEGRQPIVNSVDDEESLQTSDEGLLKDQLEKDVSPCDLSESSAFGSDRRGSVDVSESGSEQKPVEVKATEEMRERFKLFSVTNKTLPDNLKELDFKMARKKMADPIKCSVLRREAKQSCPFSAIKLHSIDFEGTQALQRLIDQSLQQETKDCSFTTAYDYHGNDNVDSNNGAHKDFIANANKRRGQLTASRRTTPNLS